MRHPLGRHEPAPGDIARVARQFLPEQLPAHRRVDAIGADQHVSRDLRAVGQRDSDAVRGLREFLDAGIEPETRIGDPAEQNVEQVGAVGVIVGRAELRLRARAERRVVEAVAIIPGAVVACFRIHTDARQRLAEPERAQDAGGVGTELDAGANLTECFGLLEELGVDAARAKRQQRGETTDASAGDEYP